MITRNFPTILSAYNGLVDELAYDAGANVRNPSITPLRWGVCLGFPELVCVEVADVLVDENLHLGMASFTKSRWTRFLRRYFREDFKGWLHGATKKLMKYPSRPFVASYSMNINVDDEDAREGHNYGGCLSSLQIRVSPQPRVILYSRACQIDKIGFLDLALIHIVGREMAAMGYNLKYPIQGTWVISNGFISAISQIYYAQRFKRPVSSNRLQRVMKRITDCDYDSIKFGPLKRGRARMMALTEHGEIPRSVPVSKLTIDEEVFIK